jgi:hypothetical protein
VFVVGSLGSTALFFVFVLLLRRLKQPGTETVPSGA